MKADVTHWGPWHTPDNKAEGTLSDVQRSVCAMTKKENVLDIFRYFTLFSTNKKYQKYKVISRYQRYEGANAIVERVRSGYPKNGLIWHFQGSGKSLMKWTRCSIPGPTSLLWSMNPIEPHRTQEGDHGAKMRLGLPNAFFFGLVVSYNWDNTGILGACPCLYHWERSAP